MTADIQGTWSHYRGVSMQDARYGLVFHPLFRLSHLPGASDSELLSHPLSPSRTHPQAPSPATQNHRGGSGPRAFAQRQQSGVGGVGRGCGGSTAPLGSHRLVQIPPAHQLAVSKALPPSFSEPFPAAACLIQDRTPPPLLIPELGPFPSLSTAEKKSLRRILSLGNL